MTHLCVYTDVGKGEGREILAHHTDQVSIAQVLSQVDVEYACWGSEVAHSEDSSDQEVLDAYADKVEELRLHHGFQGVDIVSLTPEHPDRQALRNKFLAEHTHDDFEVRFFVAGKGLFSIHAGDRVYALMCGQGDLISVPSGTRHWFDMGSRPEFRCIRLFTNPEGWVARYTGSDIARAYPDFDTFETGLAV